MPSRFYLHLWGLQPNNRVLSNYSGHYGIYLLNRGKRVDYDSVKDSWRRLQLVWVEMTTQAIFNFKGSKTQYNNAILFGILNTSITKDS